jgi:hypothetical protein
MSNSKRSADVQEIMKRYGDGQHVSVRQLAREFHTTESSVRRLMETSARHGAPWARDFALHRIDVLAQRLDQCVYELGELRRELAARSAD